MYDISLMKLPYYFATLTPAALRAACYARLAIASHKTQFPFIFIALLLAFYIHYFASRAFIFKMKRLSFDDFAFKRHDTLFFD